MNTRTLTRLGPALSLVFVIGCNKPNQDMGDMHSMQAPPRPAELDRMDSLVGDWDGQFEMAMAGSDKKMTCTGKSRSEWACDRRILVEKGEMDMGDGHTMNGMSVWAWDASAGKYRNWWFDGTGNVSEGEGTYDDATRTWHMSSSGPNPMTGSTTYGAGTMKLTDANTMEWTWKEWDNGMRWGKPVMEMSGTNRRRS